MTTRQKPLISFDYAIKYLLRDKGDFEIVEGFISAVLNTKGYGNVKIVSLLESESNREDSKSKRSIADVVVEDEFKRKFIIEIERNEKYSYPHKACFNTSRLIVDHLSHEVDYTQIVKVFHISLLYFPIHDNAKGAVYHGKTLFHEVASGEPLHVYLKDSTTQQSYETTDIFPEYFFISVPQFDDMIQNEIDEWLYVLKHDEIPYDFHSPYMKKVEDRLEILKMTAAERNAYSAYMKKICDDREELTTALEKGRAEGELNKLLSLLQKKLDRHQTDEQIMDAMEISDEELHHLKTLLKKT